MPPRLLLHGHDILRRFGIRTFDDLLAGQGDVLRYLAHEHDTLRISSDDSKHTLRAMNENARRGFFNGSRPPFGYHVTETEAQGARGKRKKQLDIDPAEAAIVICACS